MRTMCLMMAALGLAVNLQAADPPEPYSEDFEKAKAGDQPGSTMALEGDFSVQPLPAAAGEGNTMAFTLPGQPVGDYGFLFGPRQDVPVEITARVFTEKQGRRLPRFALGWGGENGLKVYVTPASKKVELYDNLDKLVEMPFEWKSGMWCDLTLKIEEKDGKWTLSGMANQPGSDIGATIIYADLPDKPRAGRASAWGTPYAGNPIFFDDLKVK